MRDECLLIETVIETVALVDKTDSIEGRNNWNWGSAEDLCVKDSVL